MRNAGAVTRMDPPGGTQVEVTIALASSTGLVLVMASQAHRIMTDRSSRGAGPGRVSPAHCDL